MLSTQRLLDAVAKRLVETLSAPSSNLSSKRKGPCPPTRPPTPRVASRPRTSRPLQPPPKTTGSRSCRSTPRRSAGGCSTPSSPDPVTDGNGAQAPDVAPASSEETKAEETED
ncbi:hypothetical protein RHMOL_Rhmol06G0069500 [Rhododendron molle]|uniref:Uncharacterized protein n=1 Tax=Rhododendron molle TaxID=49168 RepID=A0ACC0NB38_RHOML|nr:hypothetical protein RHMOL_Rhmol06G0069500 [Rhododendron molle]